MAEIAFRAKVERIYNVDDTLAYERVKVPVLARSHCDMAAMRCHPKYGAYANSDLFPAMLRRIRTEHLREYVRLDQVPAGVTVDTSGFLARVSITV